MKKNEFKFEGGLESANADLVVAADVFIMPTFQVTVAHIGGVAAFMCALVCICVRTRRIRMYVSLDCG